MLFGWFYGFKDSGFFHVLSCPDESGASTVYAAEGS
jgi:hypothetical protein